MELAAQIKQHRNRMPKNKPEIVDVPKANYIAVRGKGRPGKVEDGDSTPHKKEMSKSMQVLILV